MAKKKKEKGKYIIFTLLFLIFMGSVILTTQILVGIINFFYPEIGLMQKGFSLEVLLNFRAMICSLLIVMVSFAIALIMLEKTSRIFNYTTTW